MTPGSALDAQLSAGDSACTQPAEDAVSPSLSRANRRSALLTRLEQPHRLHPTANIVIQVVTGQLPALTK